jgi:mono/diheme cytochrome c family protein
MKNFLIVFLIVVFAVNVYGFLFGDDEPLQRNEQTSPTREQTQAREQTDPDPEISLGEGEAIFANNCASCHGRNGGGFIGPELAENNTLKDTTFVLERILEGSDGMPAFSDRFSDNEIADVASFIRNSWGNDFGEVSPRDVAAER